MTTEREAERDATTLLQQHQVPDCKDHDEDCDDIADKVSCYLYDPAKGFCPFLRAQEQTNDK